MSLPAASKYVSAVEPANVIVGSTSQEMMGISNIESIFHILSESLYSNPRYSAITEILANAWDSHIVSGKTSEPVKLTIDSENDTIIIEDSGNGIPHDKFMDLYGNLGGTSKAQDFTTTGGMGIGKLAPLALTDSFTVNNHHGGIQRTYAVVKGSTDSAGRHTIMLLNESPTDKTGLTVTYVDVGFNESEYSNFVKWDLPRLDTHVHVVYGSTDVTYKPFSDTDSFAHFYSYTYGYHHFKNPNLVSVLLGSCLFNTDDILVIPVYIKEFLLQNKLNLVLKVPEGLILNFTPNRESLIDTEHNRTILGNLLNDYLDWFNSVKQSLTDNWFEKVKRTGIRSFTRPNLPEISVSWEQEVGYFIPLDTIVAKGGFRLESLNKPYLDGCTQRSLFHNTRNTRISRNKSNPYKSKKFRKALAFMVTNGISGGNIRPRVSMVYMHSSSRFYREHGELLLTVKKINLIPISSPKYTEGRDELNLYIKKSVCRDTITKGLLKLNPNVTVTVKPSLAPIKSTTPVIRTHSKSTRTTNRKRFKSVYDYLESLDNPDHTSELTAGSKLFITSHHLAYLQLIMKAPKEFTDKLLQFAASYTWDSHIDWVKLLTDKEMLKDITFVPTSELDRYSKRASTAQLSLGRLFRHFLLHAYPEDIKNICTLIVVGGATVNNKTNNIYRYLKHNRPDIFTNHSSEMLNYFRQISSKANDLFNYSESGHAHSYLGDLSIFQVLLKMSDTPYFTPTFNSLIKLGHIQPCQNLSQSLQPVHP